MSYKGWGRSLSKGCLQDKLFLFVTNSCSLTLNLFFLQKEVTWFLKLVNVFEVSLTSPQNEDWVHLNLW